MAQVGQQTNTDLVTAAKFVTNLRALPESAFSSITRVLEFLRANPIAPESLEPFLFWDRGHYTRNLIDHTDVYDLIAVCWEVGQGSSIHNHKDQNCWMSVPIGRLTVQNYHVVHQDLASQTCELIPTDKIEMNTSNPVAVDPQNPVHSVYNEREWNERAVSVHLYSRPFDSCVVYSAEQKTCGEIKLCYTSQYGIPTRR
ncbi:MAG TPA: cysteine dioxygenase family protein [Clostridia bacterium]|nr:cysteine dioxygenase family protein [Clostridia bacterium]